MHPRQARRLTAVPRHWPVRLEIVKAINKLTAEIEEEKRVRKRAEADEAQRRQEDLRRACDEAMKALHDACRYLRKYGFNPNEPRIPAGNPGAGEWTDEDWDAPPGPGVVLSDAENTWKPGEHYAANEPPPGIGHNQGPPLEDPPPGIAEVEPRYRSREFFDFVKAAARWLAKAGWKPVLRIGVRLELEAIIGGRIGAFLAALEAAY